jgi:hypothetical protein
MPGRSLFPPTPIEEARALADTIARSNAGQPMRRIDIFDVLGRSAESGPSRNLVTSSSGFGLTTGGYRAEILGLTDLGRRLSVEGDQSAAIDAVLQVDVFRSFFETYMNSQLPSEVAARSYLASHGVPADRTEMCLQLILENGRYAGLISQRSGSEYVLSRQHAVEAAEGTGQTGQQAIQLGVVRGRSLGRVTQSANQVPLQISIEIRLPESQSVQTYDAIFASLRKHFVDGDLETRDD